MAQDQSAGRIVGELEMDSCWAVGGFELEDERQSSRYIKLVDRCRTSRARPEVSDRKQLLLRLAEAGHKTLVDAELQIDERVRRERISQALERLPALVDRDRLLEDQAWG
ncbi:MAG TPA: hypothetical protein VMU90_03295 [Solirubrobacteraceae bacterium]|nr:hypothetical protein [Solirubrobacteraceae bacterium]